MALQFFNWSRTAASNATADSSVNWSEGQAPSSVNDSARAMMASLAGYRDDVAGALLTAGTSTAYTLTSRQVFDTLAHMDGARIAFTVHAANGASPTLAVDGLTARSIVTSTGAAIVAGTLLANTIYVATYVDASTEFRLHGFYGNAYNQPAPQGRLTLQTLTPVMITNQNGKTTLYYTAYQGNQIPIYNGTNMVPTAITAGELSVSTTNTTKSPAAIGASKVNDWFVWNDAGTVRLGHGPDWTDDTTRSAGTALVMVNGINLNNATITNGPAASRGTYVGTTRSNASSELDYTFGGTGSGGGAGFFGVWNAYNRVLTNNTVTDTGVAYTYSSGTIRQARASTGNQVSYVAGLAEDAVAASYISRVTTTTTLSAFTRVGIGLDSTTVFSAKALCLTPVAAAFTSTPTVSFNVTPSLGVHFIAALEQGDTTQANSINGDQLALLSVTVRN